MKSKLRWNGQSYECNESFKVDLVKNKASIGEVLELNINMPGGVNLTDYAVPNKGFDFSKWVQKAIEHYKETYMEI